MVQRNGLGKGKGKSGTEMKWGGKGNGNATHQPSLHCPRNGWQREVLVSRGGFGHLRDRHHDDGGSPVLLAGCYCCCDEQIEGFLLWEKGEDGCTSYPSSGAFFIFFLPNSSGMEWMK